MSGIKAGFTLLELVVVVAIIALMATIIIPSLGRRNPAQEREQFVAQLNALLHHAVTDALATHMMQRIVFDLGTRRIQVYCQTPKKDSQGQYVYEPSGRPYAQRPLVIPKQYEIRNILIEGFDEMARFAGGTTKTIWFYIVPQGLAQSVVINMLDRNDVRRHKRGQEISLVLNPLLVQFRVYDAFQQ